MQILEILQFKEGSLPVKYFGMPLIPCKLSFKDCQPLLDKILARIISLGLPENCSLLEDSNYYNMYSATFKDFGLVSSYYLKIPTKARMIQWGNLC